jgi:hypothetical protein
VQKTKSNPLSEFLQFPEITPQSFEMPKPATVQTPEPTSIKPSAKPKTTLAVAPSIEEEDSDQFSRSDLKFNPTPEISPLASSNLNESDDNEPWAETNLDRFKIANHSSVDTLPEIDVDIPDVDLSIDELDLAPSHSQSPLDAKQIENLVQAQIELKIQASIDAAIWKVLPEIAERVIREELNKLLKDIEL